MATQSTRITETVEYKTVLTRTVVTTTSTVERRDGKIYTTT